MREVIPAPVPGLDLRREHGHHQSPAIRAGGMVFCSGMVAIDPQSGERQHGTVTSEARRIFENLKLLLESTGCQSRNEASVVSPNWGMKTGSRRQGWVPAMVFRKQTIAGVRHNGW
jgi:hypothetical protein